MTDPRVCAVMLALPGRVDYQTAAMEAFQRQSYKNAWILSIPADKGLTIGAMRNKANEIAEGSDIIVHWDDDDWSSPNRIAEQVALLQATGADCVGYNEMLFWRNSAPDKKIRHNGITDIIPQPGEAWLYSNPNPRYALGTSLCYWRHIWASFKFADLQHGEDTEWIRYRQCRSVSGIPVEGPRMIARIHSGNSSSAYDPIEMARHDALPRSERQWSRASEWDSFCREVME